MKNKRIILLCIGLALHNNIKTSDNEPENTTALSIKPNKAFDTIEPQNNEESESLEIQSLDKTIEKILEGKPDKNIIETLTLIKEKKTLNNEQNYIAACAFHRFGARPWMDMRLDKLFNQNKYARQTSKYQQNKKTFDEFEEDVNTEYAMFETLLSRYGGLTQSHEETCFAIANATKHEKMTEYDIYNFEQIVFNKIHRLGDILGTNDHALSFDIRPFLYLTMITANRDSDVPYYKTVRRSPATPENMNSLRLINTQISELVLDVLGMERAIKDMEVPCTKVLQNEIKSYSEENNKYQRLNCAKNEIDLAFQSEERDNIISFHYLTKKIILENGLGTEESINTLSLKSNISLVMIDKYFKKHREIPIIKQKAYKNHFTKIVYDTDPEAFCKTVKKHNNRKRDIDLKSLTDTSMNDLLRYLGNVFAYRNALLKKQLDKKTYTYEFHPSYNAMLNSVCDFDKKFIEIFQGITELPWDFEAPYAHIRYGCNFLLDRLKEDTLNFKKVMVHDNHFAVDILEKMYSLFTTKILETYGIPITESNLEEIEYSNDRILSQGNCHKVSIDSRNKVATFDSKTLFAIEGPGGWGKTSIAQTLLLEMGVGLWTGRTFTARVTIPTNFLRKKLFFYYANGSIIHMNGNKPQSGSQSTAIKIAELNELCSHALKNKALIFGYLDETLSTVDPLSTRKMLEAKEAIKEAQASNVLRLGIIEHDKEKLLALGCEQPTIMLPLEIRSKINPNFIIGELHPHILYENDQDFDEIYNILNQKNFQAGETEMIDFKLNDRLTTLTLTTPEEYKKHFTEKNNPRYFSIPYTIRTSTNQFDTGANIILNSNRIIIKPIVGEISYKGNYYIYKIDISVALENGKAKIIPLKADFSVAAKNSLFIAGNKIKFMKYSNDGTIPVLLPVSEYPTLSFIVEESINNIRTADIQRAANEHHTKEKENHLFESTFNLVNSEN